MQASLPVEYNYINCSFQTVDAFLHHCHLDQYFDIFISEGFDSITSLLEITEEDMTVMNVKRGHRRLIQREIATIKGISRDQPLVTNMMNTKYHELLTSTNLKMDDPRRSSNATQPYGNPTMNNLNSYDVIGLTSPRSMNSGVGSCSTSCTSSSSGPMSNSRSNNAANLVLPYHHHHHHHHKSTTPPPKNATNANPISLIDTRNSSSSNDDNDSIDTNESVPAKRKYRRHAKPDRNAPIKPPSAYIMFSSDARAELKHQNLSFADVAKTVGDQWKNLSHVKKQQYERMAMRAKDEYLAALEQYRQTAQYKRYKEYLDEFKQKQNAVGRTRKRPKSPGSGSIADTSSNGQSNGTGSSGSDDKESRQREPRSSADSGYTSQSYWNSDAVMRGMLPIEFVQNITPKQPVSRTSEDDEGSDISSNCKRRSPRFNKTKNTSPTQN